MAAVPKAQTSAGAEATGAAGRRGRRGGAQRPGVANGKGYVARCGGDVDRAGHGRLEAGHQERIVEHAPIDDEAPERMGLEGRRGPAHHVRLQGRLNTGGKAQAVGGSTRGHPRGLALFLAAGDGEHLHSAPFREGGCRVMGCWGWDQGTRQPNQRGILDKIARQ